jgi:hypothetical protein
MQDNLSLDSAASECSRDRRRKLRRIARVAEWISLGGIALVGTYSAYLWSDQAALTAHLQRDVPGIVGVPTGGSLILAYLASLGPAAIFVVALWEARGVFRLLGATEFFDPAAPPRLVRLGVLAVAASVAGMVVRLVVGLVMSSADPAGPRQLVIAISSSEISALIVGLLLLAFALVMREAVSVAAENRSFV